MAVIPLDAYRRGVAPSPTTNVQAPTPSRPKLTLSPEGRARAQAKLAETARRAAEERAARTVIVGPEARGRRDVGHGGAAPGSTAQRGGAEWNVPGATPLHPFSIASYELTRAIVEGAGRPALQYLSAAHTLYATAVEFGSTLGFVALEERVADLRAPTSEDAPKRHNAQAVHQLMVRVVQRDFIAEVERAKDLSDRFDAAQATYETCKVELTKHLNRLGCAGEGQEPPSWFAPLFEIAMKVEHVTESTQRSTKLEVRRARAIHAALAELESKA